MEGHFYRAEELAIWEDRAVNGPFKSVGDIFTNSPGDWDRIVGHATLWFNNFTNSTVWDGPAQSVMSTDPEHPWQSPESLRSYYMMCAAFVDLVNGTSIYTSAIKNVLLQQTQQTNTDFTNRAIYPKETWSIDQNVIWSYAEWQLKFLKTYDFIGEENFTASEQTTMRNWFAGGADWNYYLLHNLRWPAVYSNRDGNVGNYIFTAAGKNRPDPPYRYATVNAPTRMSAGSWKNNRSVTQTVFIVMCGILLGNDNYKQEGSWCTKEYLAYHWYPDGYYMELYRSTASTIAAGISYGGTTTMAYLEIAKLLYEDGYENLFDYTTTVGLDIPNGVVNPNVGVTKSLEWCVLKIRENFLLPTSEGIYPYGTSGTSTDILLHYCLATPGVSQLYMRNKPSEPAVLADMYYDNPLIKDIYQPTGANSCGYPSSFNPNGTFPTFAAAGGAYPGYNFMYGGVTYSSTPQPPDPTPSASSHTKRFRRYN